MDEEWNEDGDFKLDGSGHWIDNQKCGSFCMERKCSLCFNWMHWQPVYGGIYEVCPFCEIGVSGMNITRDVIVAVEKQLVERKTALSNCQAQIRELEEKLGDKKRQKEEIFFAVDGLQKFLAEAKEEAGK